MMELRADSVPDWEHSPCCGAPVVVRFGPPMPMTDEEREYLDSYGLKHQGVTQRANIACCSRCNTDIEY